MLLLNYARFALLVTGALLGSTYAFGSDNSTATSSLTPAATPSVINDIRPISTGGWLSPEYHFFFEYPLPIPPTKWPKLTYINNATGAAIDYYEVEVKRLEKQVYPNLPKTSMVGYDGMDPGPTFKMRKGREAVVRFINRGPSKMSVHVHGQYNRAPFDGWAADYAQPGQYKDYHYPNAQNARTIWYHDHTEFETGLNAYMGQEGFYLLSDDQEDALKLPKGDYDVPLSLSAKEYRADGSLLYETNGDNGLPGDVIQVNGQPWPYMSVEPRKYRLRLLNGAVSRSFTLSLHEGFNGSTLSFDVIASDAGLFNHALKTDTLSFSMGERYEIVVDFAKFAGKNITMRNAQGVFGNIDFAATDRVMRFVVGSTMSNGANNGAVPIDLRYIPPPPQASVTKDFTFERIDGEWLINGVGWVDIEHRILTRPALGADEIWQLRNGNGSGVHPIHIHLVEFQVLSRSGGRNVVAPYEAAGMKDVVWLSPNETIRVVARYAPWEGVYMFHCHNLVHEDHDMLVAFNVTNLARWGYDDFTVFINPMEPAFRPKDIDPADFTDEAIRTKLEWFWSLNAYGRSTTASKEKSWHNDRPKMPYMRNEVARTV